MRILRIAGCFAIGILLFASSAAEAQLCTGFTINSGACTGTPAGCDYGFFNYIVKCSTQNILGVVGYQVNASGTIVPINANVPSTFFTSMTTMFKPVTALLMTLYLVLLGYKFVTGAIPERDLRKEGMIAVVKFSMVFYFAYYMGFASYYGFFLNMMQSLVNIFTTPPTGAVDAPSVIGCNGPQYVDIWQRTDCTLYTLLGYAAGVSGAMILTLIIACIIPFIGPAIGIIGLIICGMMLLGAILMMAAYVTAALAFIMTEVGVTFLYSFAPIMIPLVLFGKTTEKIFQNWFKMTLSYSIQPVVILGYLALMIAVLNVVLFGSSDTPQSIPGIFNLISAAANNAIVNVPIFNLGPLSFFTVPTLSLNWWQSINPPPGILAANWGLIPFVINFIGALITIFLLFTFMLNVVEFSNQLVGIQGEGLAKVNMVKYAVMASAATAKIAMETGKGLVKSASTGFSDMGAQAVAQGGKAAAEAGAEMTSEVARQ